MSNNEGQLHWESWAFRLLLSLTLLPVLVIPELIGMDNQTHLYNARLIVEWFGHAAWVREAFEIQLFPIPNWTGHGILAVLMIFFSPEWAEKIHLLLLMITLATGFRSLVMMSNPRFPLVGSALALVLIWSWFVLLGFYNFLWGTAFALWALSSWMRKEDRLLPLFFSSLIYGILIYFSHPTWWLAVAMAMMLWWLIRFFHHRRFLLPALIWMGGMLPSGLLLWQFLIRQQATFQESSRLAWSTLSHMLYEFFPLVVFHGGKEGPWLRMIALGALLAGLSHWFFRPEASIRTKGFLRWSATLFFFFLAAFFFFPDVSSTGSFISSRLLFLTIIFLFLLFSAMARNSMWSWIGILLMLVGHSALMLFYSSTYQKYVPDVEIVKAWGKQLPEGATAAMINQDIWFEDNLNKALGIHGNVILLDNFEAWTGYFPLIWNEAWHERAGGGREQWLGPNETTAIKADYLLTSGKLDPNSDWLSRYHCIAREGRLALYQRDRD